MRRLDALVAERACGWASVRQMGPSREWYGQEPGRDDTNYRVPPYSTDMNAALEALDKLRADGVAVTMSCTPGMVTWDVRGRTADEDRFIAHHESLPTALCLALLRAAGVDEDEIAKAMEDSDG